MTTTTALRELAFAALQTRLSTALGAGVPVERNRRDPVGLGDETLPRLVLRDGAQAAADGSDAGGGTRYTVEAAVEGYATAADDAGLGPAVNELYRRTAAALFGAAIVLPGGQEIWPLEGRLDVDFAGAPEAAQACAGFFLQLSFDLYAPAGAPSSTY